MILVFDIGNTNTVVGVFEGRKLVTEIRLKTDRARTIDEYESLLITLLRERLGPKISFEASVISSVVPSAAPLIAQLVHRSFAITPLQVGPGIKTGIQIRISEPSSVGADRVVNAVAAKELFGPPIIVVDFGTATSFDYVSVGGDYEGGIIAPGLTIALESLVRNTAKLPQIELAWPKTVIGKSTVTAMQVGTLVGYVCMVDGLLDLMVQEIGSVPCIIATGGLGDIITAHSKKISQYEQHLTLRGLQLLHELNSPPRS